MTLRQKCQSQMLKQRLTWTRTKGNKKTAERGTSVNMKGVNVHTARLATCAHT